MSSPALSRRAKKSASSDPEAGSDVVSVVVPVASEEGAGETVSVTVAIVELVAEPEDPSCPAHDAKSEQRAIRSPALARVAGSTNVPSASGAHGHTDLRS